MTGRGRPPRAKSPDPKSAKSNTSPEERKQVPLQEQNGTTKARKKAPGGEEKPSVQSTRQDRTSKQRSDATDKSEAPVQSPRAPTGAGRAKKQEQAADKTTKTQPETLEDTTKDSLKSTKVKSCGGKAGSPGNITGTPTETQPEDTPKPCAGREDKVDSILHKTLESLKIKKVARSEAATVVNKIVKTIIEHLKKKSQSFKDVEPQLPTGSYYEHLKISHPDEFDVMLPIPAGRVIVTPFGDDGAFYSVELKRGSPLQRFEKNGTLSASEMLKEFRDEVKKSLKQSTEWEVTRKKPGCPAVTLLTTNHPIISLDIVLSIVVQSSWPASTKGGLQINGWLGTKVKQEYKRKPYYLVPKYEGVGTVKRDGVVAKDVWRVSFSHVEKAMLLNHGAAKTCCEKGGERCCRKDGLKLLKHLLSLLKEKDPSLTKFCSYQAKTTLLHACCSRTSDGDWRASDLSLCFRLLLEDFVAHLEKGVLNNFFIPTQNLLSGPGPKKCRQLAQRLREELEDGFPILK